MLDFVMPLFGGHATVNLTPILVSFILACVPVILRWAVRQVWIELKPILSRYMDERTMTMFQARFDRLADVAIQHGVSALAGAVEAKGPLNVEVKGAVAAEAVEYLSKNAPDTAVQAGDVLAKILARYDFHPAVTAAAEANDNAAARAA